MDLIVFLISEAQFSGTAELPSGLLWCFETELAQVHRADSIYPRDEFVLRISLNISGDVKNSARIFATPFSMFYALSINSSSFACGLDFISSYLS